MTDRTQPARWYMVDKDGMATLCTDREDAEQEAKYANMAWPHTAPHRAVQLVEVGASARKYEEQARDSYTAAEMATASAQGFRDGVASVAASAGSEPVIGWHAFPHYLQHPDGRLLRTASDLLARHGYTGCAEPLRAMSDVLLPTHPSPPEGMVGGWTKASQKLPPCRDDQLYIGINTAGFAGVFNVVRVIHGNTYCLMEVAEESVSIMSDLDIWQPFAPPTTTAGSGKG